MVFNHHGAPSTVKLCCFTQNQVAFAKYSMNLELRRPLIALPKLVYFLEFCENH